MQTNHLDQTSQNQKTAKSKIWTIVRWFPLVFMGISLLILLAMMAAGGLIKVTAWYLLQSIPPFTGVSVLVLLLMYGLVRKKINKLMLLTGLVAILSILPAALLLGKIAYPASIEKTSPAAKVRLPSDIPLQVIWGGDSINTNYHVFVPDQRWAYDLVSEPFLSGSSDLSDYGCYGTPVLTPADGVISVAHDGEPDEIPGQASNNTLAPTGNYVAIKLESGTYLVIAHLKPGSITVQAGDNVKEGQQIALCGNSGNTSEPHIHIHHQRQDPAQFPVNFAEGLPLFFRDHDGPAMPIGGVRVEGDMVFPTGDIVQHQNP